MAETDPDLSADARAGRQRSPRAPWLVAAAGLAALAIGLIWIERVDIAQRLIDRQIHALKLSARYHLTEIGTRREVLGDISIGNPAAPDLFIKSLEIKTGWSGGLPAITGLKLTGARLRGTANNARLSFGSLDPILFTPSAAPLRLPDMTLTLRDAQVSISGNHGPIGIDIGGSGNLREGFAGAVTLIAPALQGGGCTAHAASFHARLTTRDAQLRTIGTLQMTELACPASVLALQAPTLQVNMLLDPALDGGAGHFGMATGEAKLGHQGAARLTGGGDASLRKGVLATNFKLDGHALFGGSAKATQLVIEGQLRAAHGGNTVQGDGTLTGSGIAPDATAMAALMRAESASAGTLAAPLLADLRAAISRESANSRLSGSWLLHRSGSGTSLVLPEVHLAGAKTPAWLSLSRLMLRQAPGPGRLAVAGNFIVSGKGFPQLHGHVRPLAGGAGVATLAMPAWVAGSSSLAVPTVAIHWDRGGRFGIAGNVMLSGALPGGQVTGLTVPLEGSWSAGSGLLWGSRCLAIGFARLTVGGLDLRPVNGPAQALTVCPGEAGGAMVALGRRGPRVSVRSAGMKFNARMNGSPLQIASGTAALTWPGGLAIRDIDVALPDANPAAPASHLRLAQLTATLGAVTAGQFDGGDITLAAMPVAFHAASGNFHWADGRLTVDQTAFRVEDPTARPRFAPLAVSDATVILANGSIAATASLRTTVANRELAHVTLAHDLASSTGHADVILPGLTFDKALQPKQLSALTEGIVADAKGTVTGNGRFDWSQGHITSSGRIATTGLDFAAAFGPVTGVVGEIEFTDLLGLVTAPDQTLAIASINPGIEVDDGTLNFALQPGNVLAIAGAQWPFLDGKLALLPTRLVLGATEVRRYELRVEGLNAAKFLARLDLSNLAATGTFDGSLPLVFDETGGRIVKGVLLSRAPGGTVSYVGDLSYKDLSPMANYAFRALRALKYRQMRIGMDGALAGDIVTHVSMQGVGQGKGAKSNFITNQIARLPLRFNVNITAPFMQLVTSFRSLYDPALVADPRALGLIDAHGKAIARPSSGKLPAATPLPKITDPVPEITGAVIQP